MGDNRIYFYEDKSKLYRAWEDYYLKMGLGANKRRKKVHERVIKRRFPTKNK